MPGEEKAVGLPDLLWRRVFPDILTTMDNKARSLKGMWHNSLSCWLQQHSSGVTNLKF